MHSKEIDNTQSLGYALLLNTSILLIVGLIAIYEASSLKGVQLYNNQFHFLIKQVVGLGLGIICFFIIQLLPISLMERLALPLLITTFILLLLIFVPGAYSKVGGASRWLNLYFFKGQPAELAKLAIVFILAKNLSRKSANIQNFKLGVLPNILLCMALSALLLLQKDLGSCAVLFGVTITMLWIAGIKKRYLISFFLSIVALFAIFIIIEPYRVKRILTFLNPWAESTGSGFQILQSYVAYKNGGLFGVGLGESKQKLFYLPESHTDFILPVIGESLGFIGILLITSLFFHLIMIAMQIVKNQKNTQYKFLCFGITICIAIQVIFNFFVTVGLLPTKGLTLPFISSGTSSLLVSLIMVSILYKLNKIKMVKNEQV